MADDNTKNEPAASSMSEAQRIALERLSDQTGAPTPDDHLDKDEAAQMIAELREEAGDELRIIDLDEP